MSASVTLTRRSLLRSGALAGAAALVGMRPWAPAPAAAAPGHLLRWSYDGLVSQSFSVGSVELRLLSVSDLAGASVDGALAGSEDAFVLTFAGPLDAARERHPSAVASGARHVRDVRVGGRDPRSDRRYDAVVDRSVGAPKSRRRREAAAAASAAEAASAPAEVPARTPLVRRVALRRTPRGARAKVVLTGAAEFERVYGRLTRRGKTIAVASDDVLARRVALRFRGVPDLPAGKYSVHLLLVDGAGRVVKRRRRVTLA
jgi:hypothetical protein